MIYVCDSCGALTTREPVPEDADWTCDECGSHAAWEFMPGRRVDAEVHAQHIQRGVGKGAIFTKARRV